MSNSALVNYTLISPNKNHPRNHVIDTITIHHMAGNLSVERCGQLFQNKSRQASANYGIGTDGRIALYVDEGDRAWTSGNRANDNRAVTIEVANDMIGEPWSISDAAYKSLIALVADICKRNNIRKLMWHNDKKLIGKIDVQNMTVHRWFQSTACPGTYLMNMMGNIARDVNIALGIDENVYSIEDFRQDVRIILGASTNQEAFDKTITISTKWNRSHSLVTPLERYFAALGYYTGEIEADKGKTPIFGRGMRDATECYQSKVVGSTGKSVDGELTKKQATWRKLLLG